MHPAIALRLLPAGFLLRDDCARGANVATGDSVGTTFRTCLFRDDVTPRGSFFLAFNGVDEIKFRRYQLL